MQVDATGRECHGGSGERRSERAGSNSIAAPRSLRVGLGPRLYHVTIACSSLVMDAGVDGSSDGKRAMHAVPCYSILPLSLVPFSLSLSYSSFYIVSLSRIAYHSISLACSDSSHYSPLFSPPRRRASRRRLAQPPRLAGTPRTRSRSRTCSYTFSTRMQYLSKAYSYCKSNACFFLTGRLGDQPRDALWRH